MKILFYAPMKAPDDPIASGDRLVARNLAAALERRGHDVVLVSRFRSYDRGSACRQDRLGAIGQRLAQRLLRRLERSPDRPDLWFTYHLYHKAPDLLGPYVATALGIPYVVAEASVAGKQRSGPFERFYRESVAALGRADLVLTLNPNDAAGVRPHLRPDAPMADLPPFIDASPLLAATGDRGGARARLARRHGLDPSRPWLVTAAMMRSDQKLASYRVLAEAVSRLDADAFELLIAGAGPAEAEVRAAFAEKGVDATFLGEVPGADMPALLSACDLFVWPAVKEAYGMALIEAQASGLPVVAGASAGVAGVVGHGQTGLLPRQGDADAFAGAVRALLDPGRRRAFGEAARQRVVDHHDIASAAGRLDHLLGETLRRFRASRAPSRSIERTV
ncbi:glycosyltransferase family 4 protein [Jiella mangrovi]|uniref:Glycosyltransferase family 4 protein n=1 Tax=Jiella mangrovi TaxID=2821407 RepID=A0ABS4BKA3_9HYPH|nr:glycosyltransferase family 4 protein [Jiella mangrovi]MBP0617187.1 glycosyltransferase family 4 protein [Jiella mangrovi]